MPTLGFKMFSIRSPPPRGVCASSRNLLEAAWSAISRGIIFFTRWPPSPCWDVRCIAISTVRSFGYFHRQLERSQEFLRLDSLVDELLHLKLSAGVTLTEPSSQWTDYTMQFSFVAKKGFFGAKITGAVTVARKLLALDI